MPVIQTLLHQHAEVIVAVSGIAGDMMAAAFPSVPVVQVPAADLSHTVTLPAGIGDWLVKKRKVRQFQKEYQAIQNIIQQENIQALISDSRPGCVSEHIHSVLIQHDLYFMGNWADKMFDSDYRTWSGKFSETWIPDVPGEKNLTGNLTLESPDRKPLTYIGLLSGVTPDRQEEPVWEAAIWLSGPEPHHSILERILSVQLSWIKEKIVVVRNTHAPLPGITYPDNFEVRNFVSMQEWNFIVNRTRTVFGRPDYFLVASLASAGTQGALIFTYGNKTEKELARHQEDYRNFWIEDEHDLDTRRCIHKMQWYKPMEYPVAKELQKEVIGRFLQNTVSEC